MVGHAIEKRLLNGYLHARWFPDCCAFCLDYSAMTKRAWLLFGFLLFLLNFAAFAEETVQATATVDTFPYVYSYIGEQNSYCNSLGSGPLSPTRLGAWYAAPHDNCVSNGHGATSCGTEGAGTASSCTDSHGHVVGGVIVSTSCPSGYTKNSENKCSQVTYSCPANGGWTLVGQSCVRDSCLEGEVRNPSTGVCEVPEPVCNSPSGSIISSGYYDYGTDPGASMPNVICSNHCSATFEGSSPAATSLVGGVVHYYAEGSYVSSGDVCSTNTESAPTGQTGVPQSTCGSNQQGGYVNGVYVCKDKTTGETTSTDPAVKTETTKTQTVTNPDGSTTTTTTTTHTDGSTSTTTTTTSPDGNVTENTTSSGGGAAAGQSTESTSKDILDELKKQTEEMKKSKCEKDPDAFGCDNALDIVGVEPEESTINVAITPVTVGGAGSCPADHTVSFLGQPVTVSWQIPCQFATGIKPVILAVAWLSAALILVGAFRQEG